MASGSNEVFAALVVVAIASFVLIYLYAEARKRQRQPPGPWPWPVIGNFPALGGLPHQSLATLAAKYGGLMYLRLGSLPCIVISTAKAAKEFYQTNDANFSARPTKLAYTMFNHNEVNYKTLALTSDVHHWRKLRRFFNTELFSPGRYAAQQTTRAAEIEHMIKLLVEDCKTTGDAVDLRVWLYGVTSNTMTAIFNGKRYFGTTDAKMKIEREYLFKMNNAMLGAMVIGDFVPYLSFIDRLQGTRAKFQKATEDCNRFARKVFDLDKHRQQYEEQKNDPSYVPNVADVFLHTPLDDGQYLPDKYILKILQELLNAGTETSATLAEWAMAELITRPDLIKQAQAELDGAVHSHRLVEETDLPNLRFLQAILKETYRIHPPVPLLLPHQANQATELQGYHLPAGTMALVNAWAIHRDPSVYTNPDTFDPDRFLGRPEVNHLSASDYFELIPFGAGRRMCPGYNQGNTSSLLMLANLLYVFDWSLPDGKHTVDMSEHMGLTVGLKTALVLIAKPRFELDEGPSPTAIHNP
ncbi:hypothetical protein KC19_6G172600 [Ceratodon purpureus]|uniref:Cytochrome P450 n=1 Tax=Ceratodon purpureus TaxID=3225 RepID=A0A8T0HIK6_CERPU|nr:hypothetical protein KC19_6G172600 [Ceratodon purpureus]